MNYGKVDQDMFPKFAYTIYQWSKQPEYLLWISVSICILAVLIYPVAATVIYIANGGTKLKHMTNIGGTLQLKYVDNNDSGKVKFRGWVVFIMTLVGFVFTNFLIGTLLLFQYLRFDISDTDPEDVVNINTGTILDYS